VRAQAEASAAKPPPVAEPQTVNGVAVGAPVTTYEPPAPHA
jgi:hypothetical protein